MPRRSSTDIANNKFTEQQHQAARLMADPEERMTLAQIAKAVGVSDRTIYRWKEDRDFIDLVNDLAEKQMDMFLKEVYRHLQKQVSKGNVKAIELALKRAGKLKEIHEVSQETKIEIEAVGGKTNQQLLDEIAELERKVLLQQHGTSKPVETIEIDGVFKPVDDVK